MRVLDKENSLTDQVICPLFCVIAGNQSRLSLSSSEKVLSKHNRLDRSVESAGSGVARLFER